MSWAMFTLSQHNQPAARTILLSVPCDSFFQWSSTGKFLPNDFSGIHTAIRCLGVRRTVKCMPVHLPILESTHCCPCQIFNNIYLLSSSWIQFRPTSFVKYWTTARMMGFWILYCSRYWKGTPFFLNEDKYEMESFTSFLFVAQLSRE